MSIEKAIEDLTYAMRALTAAVNGAVTGVVSAPVPADAVPVDAAPSPPARAPRQPRAAAAAAAPEPGPAPEPMDYEELKSYVTSTVVPAIGAQGFKNALTEAGYKSGPEIPPSERAAFKERLAKLVGEAGAAI